MAVSLGGRGGGFEWFVESSVKSGLVVECEEIADGVWVKIKKVKHSSAIAHSQIKQNNFSCKSCSTIVAGFKGHNGPSNGFKFSNSKTRECSKSSDLFFELPGNCQQNQGGSV